ncbi:hypothetical protein ABBQ32_000574 [Trebouxia sp. C0010 RCD-2024]
MSSSGRSYPFALCERLYYPSHRFVMSCNTLFLPLSVQATPRPSSSLSRPMQSQVNRAVMLAAAHSLSGGGSSGTLSISSLCGLKHELRDESKIYARGHSL